MRTRSLMLVAALALGAAGAAAPARAVDFLGIPLWESYPGQYDRPGYYYHPPGYYYYYDAYTGRYYYR